MKTLLFILLLIPTFAFAGEPDCKTVSEAISVKSSLTDLQKTAWIESLKGGSLAWTIQVQDISKKWLGGYSLKFKCPDSDSFLDGVIDYTDEQGKHLESVSKGSKINVHILLTHTAMGFVYGKAE